MAPRPFVFVGTYTRKEGHVDGKGRGVSVYELLDDESGALRLVSETEAGVNPSFVAVHPSGKWLYAVTEEPEGTVRAFAIDSEHGTLTSVNQVSASGSISCHVVVEPSAGRFVLVANYGDGSVASFAIDLETGALSERRGYDRHVRASHGNQARQEAPHAHSFFVDAHAGASVVVGYSADLGGDEIIAYRMNADDGALERLEGGTTTARLGSGPRHLAQHPLRAHVWYAINELDSSVSVLHRDAHTLRLDEVQHITTLPSECGVPNTTADIHVHPSGRFVFASNRGHDSIVSYRVVDEHDGRLELVGHTSTQGRTPRNFCLHPNGRLMLVANQDSSSIVAFAIDAETGIVSPTGVTIESPTPVCLVYHRYE